MYSAPWAKFTMRIRPKIKVSPTPRKNSNADSDSALTSCVRKNASVLTLVGERHRVAGRRRGVAREGGDDLRHRRVEARLLDDLDHEALLHPLVIALAHEHLALDALDLDVLQRRPELVGLDAARLGDAGVEHLHALPLLALEGVGQRVVFLLPRRHELVVQRMVVAEAVARRADQSERSVADGADAGEVDDLGQQLDLVGQAIL